MKTKPIVSRLVCLSVFLVHAFVGASIAAAADPPLTQPGGKITLNAMINNQGAIHAMDNNLATYVGISIDDGKITGLSATPFDTPTLTLPPGAAIYPGLIDSHSHAISLPMAAMKSPGGNLYWTSLANVNVMMLPPCPGPSPCYQPVTTQAQVETLLSGKANDINWVLGWNYEPSRLTCDEGYGFLCPNYENQYGAGVTALASLDGISKTTPILVTSQSGHLVYVNSAALAKLNICGTPGANEQCYRPIFNPDFETLLANQGQLDEDLALYAIGFVENLIASNYGPSYYTDQIVASLHQYSSLGYTTVQEGAASAGLIQTYMNLAVQLAAKGTYLPATMAFLGYDGTTAGDIGPSVQGARTLQAKMTAGGYDMFIAGMKAYSDGSTQGYTGELARPTQYYKLPDQFHLAGSDYDGLPDYDECEVTVAAREAHRYGFPLWVHTNGNQAQTNVINGLTSSRSPKVRDVIVHFSMPTQEQVKTVAANGIGATFLVNDFYYYYQPLCELMIGPAFDGTANLYPTKWARDAGLVYGLHSDVSVTPPSPMFGIWVASTRNVQQVGGHGLLNGCQAARLYQQITRGDALKAYTSAAAWLYNRETKIGSLQKGYAGDLVVLSADPYDENTDLSKVCVLYTIHNGNVVYSAPNCTPPVWPN